MPEGLQPTSHPSIARDCRLLALQTQVEDAQTRRGVTVVRLGAQTT